MDRAEVEAVLEREVRPQLRTHGGNIELIEVTEDGVVRFWLTGACGGCNPRYDRVALVRELEQSSPGLRFRPEGDCGRRDTVLAVCGCPVQCALRPEERENPRVIPVRNPEELPWTRALLARLAPPSPHSIGGF